MLLNHNNRFLISFSNCRGAAVEGSLRYKCHVSTNGGDNDMKGLIYYNGQPKS